MWGIWAVRSPNSRMGYAEAWSNKGGQLYQLTEDKAKAEALRLNRETSTLAVTYFAKEY